MPRIVLQRLLEQLERLDVEVVGRLVQHEHVGGLREQPREQQPVALAAREHAHRRIRALRREQEIAEVADDVAPSLAFADPVRVRAHGRRDGGVGIELRAQLVEVGDAQLRAQPHRAGIGRELAEDQLEQRRLARAVRARPGRGGRRA